jgi:hypothetical protein
MPVSPDSIDQAQDFLVKQFRNYSSGDVSGYWTAACSNQESGNICKVIRLDDKNQVTFAEEDNQRKFTALCSLKKSDSAVETHTYIYTCQCNKGYGYENCRYAHFISSFQTHFELGTISIVFDHVAVRLWKIRSLRSAQDLHTANHQQKTSNLHQTATRASSSSTTSSTADPSSRPTRWRTNSAPKTCTPRMMANTASQLTLWQPLRTGAKAKRVARCE